MVKYLLYILILCCAGCKPHRGDKIDISRYEILYDQTGGKDTISVSATSFWTARENSDWIKTVHSSSGEHCFIFVSPNDSTSRNDSIFFICGADTATLRLYQSHNTEFSLSEEEIRFSYRGGSAQIKVVSFCEWTVEEKSEWIGCDIIGGESPMTVTIHIPESDSTQDTEGYITFASSEKELSVKVIQYAKPYIKLEKDSTTIDGDGGNISLLYLTNSAFTISNESIWIRTVHHDTISKRVKLEILRNNEYATRKDSVTFICCQDTSIYKSLYIRQSEKINHPALGFEEGHSIEIASRNPFVLHPTFTDMKDSSLVWHSSDTQIASVDQRGSVTVNNTGECKISISNTYHDVSAQILLKIKLVAENMTVMLDKQDMNENPTAVRYSGENLNVKVTLYPEGSYTGDLFCLSSDQNVASIDGMKIKCISPGITTIKVESHYHQLSYSFKLIVLE